MTKTVTLSRSLLFIGLAVGALIGIASSLALVLYILWKSDFGAVLVRIGTDVLRYGIYLAVIGSVCSLLVARLGGRYIWIVVFSAGLLIVLATICLHGYGVACTSKKNDTCEPLWFGEY